MAYKESKKKLDELRRENEVMFRMAISHLLDCGIRHLTEESIKETCEAIMQEDDAKHFMTNEFKCELIRMAGELAKIDHIHLLVYISREIYYSVDNKVSYQRAIELVEDCMTWIGYNEGSYSSEYRNFKSIGFTDEELEEFGYKHLLTEEDE